MHVCVLRHGGKHDWDKFSSYSPIHEHMLRERQRWVLYSERQCQALSPQTSTSFYLKPLPNNSKWSYTCISMVYLSVHIHYEKQGFGNFSSRDRNMLVTNEVIGAESKNAAPWSRSRTFNQRCFTFKKCPNAHPLDIYDDQR